MARQPILSRGGGLNFPLWLITFTSILGTLLDVNTVVPILYLLIFSYTSHSLEEGRYGYYNKMRPMVLSAHSIRLWLVTSKRPSRILKEGQKISGFNRADWLHKYP